MSTTQAAAGVAWDLSDLYAGRHDPSIAADLEAARRSAEQFAERYRGRIHAPGLDAPTLAEAVRALESILEAVGKACVYASLVHAADAAPSEHGALLAMTQEKASEIRQQLLFFDIEWLAVDDAVAQPLIDHPACSVYRHYLASSRRYRPHTLSEPEERILEEKANTGGRAFSRLFDELLAAMSFDVEIDGKTETLNESSVLALLHDGRREVRQTAAAALTQGLESNGVALGFIFNTLAYDHYSDDRLRAYPTLMHSRHLANEISHETVAALMSASESRHDVVQRYYRLKRELLGLPELCDFDRYAPITTHEVHVPWGECRQTVLDAYRSFSPRMAEIAEMFFERNWIDAELRPAKRGGAFSSSTIPSAHPYVLVNYTGQTHDVMTVAHELGHGVHQYLSRRHGYLQADTPLTTAETASIFGEMLVFEALLKKVDDPRQRLALLCHRIEDTIGTVFRQIALTRFEEHLHAARRAEGELSRERICDLWEAVNRNLYGDSVTLTPNYRWWWAYIPHFIHTPFYCYAYGFGDLLVMALYEMYRREGSPFVDRYLALLEAGGSDTPANLLQRVGVDISDPGFWQLGLAPFTQLVDEAIALTPSAGQMS